MAKTPRFFEKLGIIPSAEPSSPTKGQIYYNSTTNKIFQYNGSAWVEVGGGAGGLSAYSAGTAYVASPADVIYYTDNKIYKCIVNTSAGESPASHPAKWQALSLEASSLDELSDVAITGASAYDSLLNNGTNFVNIPTENYIKNDKALFNTTSWNLYDDGAVATPVDGTGGSPSTLTLSRTTTAGEVLKGSASFKIAKSAANGQGEGWSYDFTVPRCGASTPHKIIFNYQVTSNFSYTNNDVVVYIYDATAGALIQPTPYTLDGSGKAVMEFQTNANTSTSYRLIFHVATTNANAWDFIFDNVEVSATPAPSMINLQDKQYNLTVTGTNWTTTRAIGIPYKTKDGTWRLRFNIYGDISVAVNGFTGTISGVVFKNTSNNYSAITSYPISGSASLTRASVVPNTGNFYVDGNNTSTRISVSGDVELESMPTWAVDYYPVQLGDGAETRVVAAYVRKITESTGVTGDNTVIFGSVVKDTHSAYNNSTGIYTVPVTGWYAISGTAELYSFSANTSTYARLYDTTSGSMAIANGVSYHNVSIGGLITHTYTFLKYYTAGTQFKINVVVPSGTANLYGESGIDYTYLTVHRVSGPATIAAAEKVYAEYQSGSAQSISAGVATIVNFGTKINDSHNAVTTGASWKFTAPIIGEYIFNITLGTNSSVAWTVNDIMAIRYKINGGATQSAFAFYSNATTTADRQVSTLVKLSLNSGDYVNILSINTPALTLNTGVENRITIYKIN